MRAIDVHVHPMNDAYVEASLPFMPAAQRMFKGKFNARPDAQIAEEFRRDDMLAIPIAWDAENGAAGGVYSNEQAGGVVAATTLTCSCRAGRWSIRGVAARGWRRSSTRSRRWG